MESSERLIELYRMGFIICLCLAAVFLLLSIFFFFKFRIRDVFDFYSVEIFNRCENSNDILLAISSWESVHPLMKIIPVEWNYSIPFGLLYASEPSEKVKRLIRALEQLKKSK